MAVKDNPMPAERQFAVEVVDVRNAMAVEVLLD